LGAVQFHDAFREHIGPHLVLSGVKRRMALTDTQLGVLAGPVFAVLNAAAALPLARIADLSGRVRVLAACTMLWSAFTALSGVATGLAAARACVGFADAAAVPVSQSLLAAARVPGRRPGVLAALIAGSYGGTVLGVAVFGIASTLLGQMIGPLLVGTVSDLSARTYGGESLRVSLEIVSVFGLWPAVHLYRLTGAGARFARCRRQHEADRLWRGTAKKDIRSDYTKPGILRSQSRALAMCGSPGAVGSQLVTTS
jgi:MFS family permease